MKYISILILSILLASCDSDTDTVTIPVNEYKIFKGDTVKPEYPRDVYWKDPYESIQKSSIVKIENHEYLMGTYNIYDSRAFYMVHYPDCKFCKKDTIK